MVFRVAGGQRLFQIDKQFRLLIAEQHQRLIQQVGAVVVQKPPAELRQRLPVPASAEPVPAHPDLQDLAEPSAVEDLTHFQEVRLVPPVLERRQGAPGFTRYLDGFVGLGHGQRHRLFTHDVFARTHRRDRMIDVIDVR